MIECVVLESMAVLWLTYMVVPCPDEEMIRLELSDAAPAALELAIVFELT